MILTVFDIITLTVILVSSILGLYRGFLNMLVNFLGFLASIVVAFMMYPHIRDIFEHYIKNELAISISSGIVSYVVSLIFFTFVISKITLFLSKIAGGFFDKSLGFFVGFVRGVAFAVIIFAISAVLTTGVYLKADNIRDMFLKLKSENYSSWLRDSITTAYYDRIMMNIIMLLPDDMLTSIKIPSDEQEDEKHDIIGKIKNQKDKIDKDQDVESDFEFPMDEELKKGINELESE